MSLEFTKFYFYISVIFNWQRGQLKRCQAATNIERPFHSQKNNFDIIPTYYILHTNL